MRSSPSLFMPPSPYLTLWLIGLLSGAHCVGMCGGIVGALSLGAPRRAELHLAYNIGRMTSYALAGAIAGGVGEASIALSGQWPVRTILYFLANFMLIALGLYLLGVHRALAFSEQVGQHLWRHLQPLSSRFLPARSTAQAFPLGLLWGWLPCGLVYSALATALTSGSAARGAGMMLAFGAGTLPSLLLTAWLADRLRRQVQKPAVQRIAGLIVLGFGVWGIVASLRMILPGGMSALARTAFPGIVT